MSPILPKIQSGAFIVKLAVAGAILSLGIILNLSDLLILNLVGTILIGLMYAHAVELQHQCLHHTAFNSRRANRIVGVILGLPMLASFHAYRKAHFEHHRKLGTSGDQEFFSYRFVNNPTILNFVYDLFGVAQLSKAVEDILDLTQRVCSILYHHKNQRFEAKDLDYGMMICLLGMALFHSIYTETDWLLKFWLIPMLLVAQPLHYLIELPEHFGCASGSTDVFRNTRTIVGSRFSAWLTNSNNFHVEHHQAPGLSMDQLPDAFEVNRGHHHYLSVSYLEFYRLLYNFLRESQNHNRADAGTRRPA